MSSGTPITLILFLIFGDKSIASSVSLDSLPRTVHIFPHSMVSVLSALLSPSFPLVVIHGSRSPSIIPTSTLISTIPSWSLRILLRRGNLFRRVKSTLLKHFNTLTIPPRHARLLPNSPTPTQCSSQMTRTIPFPSPLPSLPVVPDNPATFPLSNVWP